jgi:arylsulfatase A-like enzyme
MSKPNILFIMVDQFSAYCLSSAGHEQLETPNIDRLAREGMQFANAYTPSPVCAPARAAVFSGMYPPGCGVPSNWQPFRGDVTLLPERLQECGYQTAAVGKLHFVPHLKSFGFQHKRLHDATYNIYSRSADFSDYVKWLQEKYYQDDPGEPIRRAEYDELARKERDDEMTFYKGSNWRTEEQHSTTWTADESIAYLRSVDRDRPFFLFSSFFGPHQPYAVPSPWNDRIPPEAVELPPQFYAEMADSPIFQARKSGGRKRHLDKWGEAEFKELISAYYGGVLMIDHYVGEIFATLEEQGLWDSTMIIFVADHGDHLGRYGILGKGSMLDSCCRIPLLVKPAGASAGNAGSGAAQRPAHSADVQGNVVQEIVNSLDLYGTILEAAGDENWKDDPMEAEGIEARSFLGLIERYRPDRSDYAVRESDVPSWENETFSIIGREPDQALTMYRRDHLKLIRLARPDAEPLYELYDMRDEPLETKNVAEDPSYREARAELQARLDAWWAEQAERWHRPLVEFRWGQR